MLRRVFRVGLPGEYGLAQRSATDTFAPPAALRHRVRALAAPETNRFHAGRIKRRLCPQIRRCDLVPKSVAVTLSPTLRFRGYMYRADAIATDAVTSSTAPSFTADVILA